MGWLVGLAVLGGIIYVVALVLTEVFRILGEAANATAATASTTMTASQRFIERIVGRVGNEGSVVETFRPSLSITLPTGWETNSFEESKRAWKSQLSDSKPPVVVVPTFPGVPDPVLKPDVQFSLGSTAS